MLKFVKHHMESIDGIALFPMISFLLFFSFFVLMLLYVWKADKKRMHALSALPLDLETPSTSETHEKA
jgi:hypothetical protein